MKLEALNKFIERIDVLSLRERGLLLLGIVVVLYMLWDSLLMRPLERHHKQVTAQIKQLTEANAALAQQTGEISKRQAQDPDVENRARLTQLQGEIEALDRRIKARTQDLIDPDGMARVLEDVLGGERGLKVVAVHSLPAEPLLDTPTDRQGKAAAHAKLPGIYRHGMVLEFEGGYLDALHYLRALEALPWRLFWDGVEFKVLDYPTAHFTVTVHTLSLREGWIGV